MGFANTAMLALSGAQAFFTEVRIAKTSGQSLVQANRTAGNLFRDELAEALEAEGPPRYRTNPIARI